MGSLSRSFIFVTIGIADIKVEMSFVILERDTRIIVCPPPPPSHPLPPTELATREQF